MLLQILSLVTSVALAKEPACTLDYALENPSAHKACAESLAKAATDEQDRSEMKYLFQRWKPIKGLHVFANDPYIAAEVDGHVLFRAVWLSYRNPAILWLDGQILTDNSNGPSIFRTVEKLLKKTQVAEISLFDEAHAVDGPKTEFVKDVLSAQSSVLASLRRVQTDADDSLGEILPGYNWISKMVTAHVSTNIGKKLATHVDCDGNKLKGPFSFGDRNNGYEDQQPKTITPLSPIKFKITNLRKNSTHLINIWHPQYDARNTVKQLAEMSSTYATVSECEDPACEKLGVPEKMNEWNVHLGMGPQEAKWAQRTGKAVEDHTSEESKNARYDLGKMLFGLSVAGDCCADEPCRKLVLKKYGIHLQQPTKPATTR